MTADEVFTLLRPVIIAVTGIPDCIPGDDNEAAPTGPYAALKPVTTYRPRGRAKEIETILPDGTIQQEVRIQAMADATLIFYRTGAVDFANRMLAATRHRGAQGLLWGERLKIWSVGPINDLTVLQSGNREERAQTTLTIGFPVSTITTIAPIEKVPYRVDNENGDKLIQGIVDGTIPLNPGV